MTLPKNIEQWTAEPWLAIMRRLDTEGTYLGYGKDKAAFLVHGLVVKVARGEWGRRVLAEEHRLCNLERPAFPVADCVLLDEDTLLMEYVERLPEAEADAFVASLPRCPPDSYDGHGGQVGRTADGRVVFFDYAP